MDTARTIRIVIDANAAKAGAAQANAALASIGKSARGAEGNLGSADAGMRRFAASTAGMGKAAKAANDNISKSNNGLLNMAKGLGKASIALAGLTALTGGVTALALALTGAADKAALLEGKLRNATKTQAGYAAASANVRRIANETRSELTAVGDLYAKMARSAGNLGMSTDQVGVATKTFSQILAVSGATAQQAESAILQLGQSMAKGNLNGDEFTSLSENANEFMEVMAKSMGVSRGELLKLKEAGKLTGKEIAKALTDPKIVADIEARFGQIPVTFANVKTAIGNALIDIAGALKEGLGIDQSLGVMLAQIQTFAASARPFFVQLGQQIREVFGTLAPIWSAQWAVIGPIFGLIATNLDTVTRLALTMGAAFATAKTMMMLQPMITQVVALGVSMGATGGLTAFFSGAVATATVAVNTFTASLLANPITVIPTLIVAATAALIMFADKIKLPGQEFGRLNDIIAAWWGATVNRFKGIVSAVVSFGSNVKKIFDMFKVVGNAAFGAVANAAASKFKLIMQFGRAAFDALNNATGGYLGKFLSMARVLISVGLKAFNWFKTNWSQLPSMVGSAVVSAVNWVIDGIEKMANRGVDAINKLIAAARTLPGGAGLKDIGDVKLDRWAPGATGRQINATAEQSGRARHNEWLSQPGNSKWNFDAYETAAQAEQAKNIVGGGGPLPSLTGDKSSGGGGGGETDAERQAKAIKEYWAGLDESAASARLLGAELERHNSILEYRKILGEDEKGNLKEISALDRQRITDALILRATNAAIANLTQENAELVRAGNLLTQEGYLLNSMSADKAKEEMTIRTALSDKRANLLREQANMGNEELDRQLRLHEQLLRNNAAEAERNRLLAERQSEGLALSERYARERDPAGYARKQYEQRAVAITTKRGDETWGEFGRRITEDLKSSAAELRDDLNDVSKQFHDRMTSAITQIGDAIGGEWGAAVNKVGQAIAAMAAMARGDNSKGGILGGIADLFGKDREGKLNDFGEAFTQGTKNIMSFSKEASSAGWTSLKSLFSGNGPFTKSLGSVMGRAAGGMQVGAIVGGIGKALFKDKFSNTGSQIGGMIGSFIPIPGGSIIGSIAGGLIGGLFKKTAKATSGITLGANGELQVSTSGNKAGQKEEAAKAGQSVVDGIMGIANRLGATLGGNPNVGIVKYKDTWKITTDGSAVGKKNGISFGSAEDAIRAAVQNLIQDGILQGLSSFSDRLLRSSSNLDSAVALAEGYEKLLKELGALKDPIGSAITDLTTNLDKLLKGMIANGATSQELAKVDEYRRLKLDAMLKESLSGLTDFKRVLFGEGSGVSALNRLTSAQSQFAGMQAVIAGGGSVDQGEFTRIGQEVLGLARDVYGTSSSQFQAIRQALIAATDGAITNVTKTFNDATVVAINQQTDAANQNATITNDLLRQQNELLRRIAGGGGYSANDGMVVNGRFVGAAL